MNNTPRFLAVVSALAACLFAACAGNRDAKGHADKNDHRYVLVYLVSGPNSGQGTPDERKAMFAGHMANINRLAQSRELLIAGPFEKPADTALRGLFVLDVATATDAAKLVQTDPGVIAGEFKAQLHEMRGPAGLTRALDLYNEQQAAKAANEAGKTTPTGAPPPEDMRKYVLIRAKNATDAKRAATATGVRVVWWGQMNDGAGILALDSMDPAAAKTSLQKAGFADFDASGWWSTSALMGLSVEER